MRDRSPEAYKRAAEGQGNAEGYQIFESDDENEVSEQ